MTTSKALPILQSAPSVADGQSFIDWDDELGAAPPWTHQPTVEWQVVGQCNYDCSYCIQSKKHRVGIPADDSLRRAIAFLARLPVTDDIPHWEVKTTGGEPFSARSFLDVVVPGLMGETPHQMGTLTNLSPSVSILQKFAKRTFGRLSIVSASLHLEFADVDGFLHRLQALRDAADSSARFVVNAVLVPGRLDDVARAKVAVEAAGFRFFPQLMKVKGGVYAYDADDIARVEAIVGGFARAGAERSANLAPAYTGRRCFAGARYLVLTKDGDAWSCRTAKRHGEGYLGNVDDVPLPSASSTTALVTGTEGIVLHPAARACPYTICPCATPANRGMIEGVSPRFSVVGRSVGATPGNGDVDVNEDA